MSDGRNIGELELHAFLDGELPPARHAEIAAVLEEDPVLAGQLAEFAQDKAALKAAFGAVAEQKLPDAWLARIAASAPATPRRAWHARVPMALAACLVLAVAATLYAGLPHGRGSILQDAARARTGELAASSDYGSNTLPAAAARDALLRHALGLRVRAPDLGRFGYRLVAMALYRAGPAAGLRYRRADGRELTLFLRRSDGSARFDLLRQGKLRICLWQDDVVGAVLSGEMSAGEMMRLASLAYASLNI